MFSTRTGTFPIGFRRGWSDWQKDLSALLSWSVENGLTVIDVGSDADKVGAQVTDAGLSIGSADLKSWSSLISPDPEKRKQAIEENAAYFEACSVYGVSNYFAVMLPEDPSLPRADNYGFMVESLNELAPVLESNHAKLVIEGWPGPGALCCTPETYRAALLETPDAIGINYDPSHLLRMGIDPVRFVEEFAERVYHVHGKDTEIVAEDVYEFGTEQPGTFVKGHGFGGNFWRYTIPGHGQTPWGRVLSILENSGYSGAVCIELEDENFNRSEVGEKEGILSGAAFLAQS
jgi:sugar phosphate isomerase/epimerase